MKEVLEKCQNMFGRILPEYKEKIKSYIIKSSPTTDDWADIAHILVTPRDTVWNIVLWMYPDFPRVGRKTDLQGRILKDWKQVPTGFQVARALQEYFRKLEKYFS